MEALPIPVGRLESIKDMATVVANALNPLALNATGSAAASPGAIALAASPLLGSQVRTLSSPGHPQRCGRCLSFTVMRGSAHAY
jgi:hypothetical protein